MTITANDILSEKLVIMPTSSDIILNRVSNKIITYINSMELSEMFLYAK